MSNPKTTLAAIVTAIAYFLGVWGFDLGVEVQNAIVVVGLFLIGLVAGDARKKEE